MDKKAKKRMAVLRERTQKLQKMLAGVKQQQDDPDEIQILESELAKIQAELDVLRKK